MSRGDPRGQKATELEDHGSSWKMWCWKIILQSWVWFSFSCRLSALWKVSLGLRVVFFFVLICCLAFENIGKFAAYFAFLDSFYCFRSRVDGRGQGCCLLLHNVHIYLALIYFPTVSSLVRHQHAQTVKKKLSKPPWGLTGSVLAHR